MILKNSNNDTCRSEAAISGWEEISQEEFDVIVASRQITPDPPTALEQIRALEAQYSDAQARMTRQSLLAIALEKACADPSAAGYSTEQVHALLMAGDNGYAALYTLEQQVSALRAQL